jgi:type VI secretion system protein ImpG
MWLRLPGDDRPYCPLDGYFTAQGFGEDDNLWPKGRAAASAAISCCWSISPSARSLCFRRCAGWKRYGLPAALPWFEIDVVLEKRWEHDFSFTEKHLRLNCVPVINLFPLESDPLTLDGLQTEYAAADAHSGRPYRNLLCGFGAVLQRADLYAVSSFPP